jgi:hypothetical protein
MLWSISHYYGYQALLYFIELGGVIIVAAAAFTLARMNQTNELTAMLASGVNLHRVVWPIILCAIALGGLIILDQELIIPHPSVRPHLARSRDEPPGKRKFSVDLIADGARSIWNAPLFKPDQETMHQPVVLLRDEEYRPLSRIVGKSARPGRLDGEAGWVFQNAALGRITHEGVPWPRTPSHERVWSQIAPQQLLERAKKVAREAGVDPPPDGEITSVEYLPSVTDRTYNMVLRADRIDLDPFQAGKPRGGRIANPRFSFSAEGGIPLGTFQADSAVWHAGEEDGAYWELINGRLFYPSDLTTDYLVLRQSSRWVNYMSTAELTRLLRVEQVGGKAALLVRHTRFIDPINNLIMLLLGLPFILSRERTIKASASGCLLVVCLFYLCVYACRYVDVPPQWASLLPWLPILVFGPAAAVMYDSVKT